MEDAVIAKKTALDLLAKKPYSKKALLKKLAEKGISKEKAQKATDYLEDLGYINDEQFANELCEYYFKVKKYGEMRVVQELLKKGIDKDFAKELVSEYSEENQSEILAVLKKEASNKDLSDLKIKNRIFNKLVRQGFLYDDIKSAFREYRNGEFEIEY